MATKGPFSVPYHHLFQLAQDSKQSRLHPPTLPLPGLYPREVWPPQIYKDVHSSFIQNSQRLNGTAVEGYETMEKSKLLSPATAWMDLTEADRARDTVSWLLF